MMPTLSRICGRPCLIFSAFISRKNNEIFRNKVSFCFLVNSLPQFCPKTVPFFFLSESSKCLNYLFCMSNLRFEISWKKSAKTIGNSCFCRINHLLAVWKSAMMDNTHDQVQKKKKKNQGYKKFNKLSKTFYFFEKMWDLVELCVCVMSDFLQKLLAVTAVCNLFPLFPEKKWSLFWKWHMLVLFLPK